MSEGIRFMSKGNEMPQFFNYKAVIPALHELDVEIKDARDYAIVGWV